MTQDELADRVSKSRTAITNSLRLLKLDERVRKMVVEEMITTGHARALLSISDPDKQYEFAQKVFDEKMSVREVEKAVKKLGQNNKVTKEKVDSQLKAVYEQLEENLKELTGTKVRIHAKDASKGKIEIEYYSKEDLERIVNLIGK